MKPEAGTHEAVVDVRGLVTRFGAQTVHDGLDLQIRLCIRST
jgi:phospholipid/cholesterol/gamma-HCH transport system ATP-binding protein